jgi:hypothetical protein
MILNVLNGKKDILFRKMEKKILLIAMIIIYVLPKM